MILWPKLSVFLPMTSTSYFPSRMILLRSVPTPTTHSVCAMKRLTWRSLSTSLAKCLKMSVDLHKYLLPNKAFQPITSREGDFDTVSCIARGSWTPDCYADALSLKLVSFSINLKIAKSVQLIECDKHFWYFEPARYTHDILGSNVYGITKHTVATKRTLQYWTLLRPAFWRFKITCN